jgi:hypothetical protein
MVFPKAWILVAAWLASSTPARTPRQAPRGGGPDGSTVKSSPNDCPVGMSPSRKWARTDLVGVRLTLVDPWKIQSYWFLADGSIVATIGDKSGEASPLLFWRIEKSGELTLLADRAGKKIVDTFQKRCEGELGFLVDAKAGPLRFTREKQGK